LIRFFKEIANRIYDDRVFDLAAQCGYYFLLSLFPFLLFTMTLLGFLPITSEDVLGLISKYAPGKTNELIESTLRGIMDVRRSGLLSIGLIVTIWSASSGIDSLIRALNYAYGIRTERPYVKAKLMAISLTFVMIFVILSALSLNVFGNKIGHLLYLDLHLSAENLTLWHILRWLISFIILNVVFTLLYLVAPNKRVLLREAVPGSIIATIGWQVISLGFSYYVNNFANFSAMYGSLGGVIILMIWFYLSAMILIIGGEINATLPLFFGRRREG
jgi:membrane protein